MKLKHSTCRKQGRHHVAAADVVGGAPGCDRLSTCESPKAGTKPVRRGEAAFTMVEIALCLAIVAFALVAIIGVLPAGLNVQKENREETIINQDATIWMDALRSGSLGYNDLVRYVDRVVVSSQNFDANGPLGATIVTVAERSTPTIPDPAVNNRIAFGNDSSLIVGLLSTPRIGGPTVGGALYSTNYVYALVRAFSGSAVEKAPQSNANVLDLAFSYRLVVETTRSGSYDPGVILTNRVNQLVRQNLSDVRLLFRWPLKRGFYPTAPLGQPEAGLGRLVFRTGLSGELQQSSNNTFPNVGFYYLQPRDYKP